MKSLFKTPDDSPGFLLWQLTNQWQRKLRQELSKLGLTHSQFVVLAGILWLNSQSENAIIQKDVSDLTKIDKMSMSDLIMTLIQKKFLRRSPHLKDGRAYSLGLTKRGNDLVLKALPIVEKADLIFFQEKKASLEQLIKAANNLIR